VTASGIYLILAIIPSGPVSVTILARVVLEKKMKIRKRERLRLLSVKAFIVGSIFHGEQNVRF
jgi:hypothetical protein